VGYATLADLTTYGLPATALGQLTAGQQQAALDQASKRADNYLRGRYALPLVAYDTDLTELVCRIAAFNLLCIRGYNPAAAADVNIKQRHDMAIRDLELVQKQQMHLNVTPAPSQVPDYDQPTLISSSVVNVGSGATGSNRGW
jgi:phage gp36-like protein